MGQECVALTGPGFAAFFLEAKVISTCDPCQCTSIYGFYFCVLLSGATYAETFCLGVNTSSPTDACMGKLAHHWYWFGACMAPSYYLNQCHLLSIEHIRTYSTEIFIEIQTFSFKEMCSKLSAKLQQFCIGFNVLYVCRVIVLLHV